MNTKREELAKLLAADQGGLCVWLRLDNQPDAVVNVDSVAINGDQIQLEARLGGAGLEYVCAQRLAQVTGLPQAWLVRQAKEGNIPFLKTGTGNRGKRFDVEAVRYALHQTIGWKDKS